MPSSAATLAALRPLLRHNSSASFLYSSVYLALLRDGLLNCVFICASFRFLTLCPLSVKSMQPYSDPFFLLLLTPSSSLSATENHEEIACRLSRNHRQLHFRSHGRKFARAFIETALEIL